jgi:hypothetical protein
MSGRKTESLTATPHPLMIRKKGKRKEKESLKARVVQSLGGQVRKKSAIEVQSN